MTPREVSADLLAEITALREHVASLTRDNAELQGALEQGRHREAATSEILRVISNSPADLTPVLESVARNAARLCEADDVSIIRAESDGITILFSLGPAAAYRGQRFPTIRSATSRAINEGRTIHVPDLLADPYYETRPEFQGFAWRSGLAVPLLRDGAAIGTITARRSEVRPFSDVQIKLLETFADQAVIAIENVRLFKELETRNSDLTQALARQTATSDVLRVISQSPTNLQPVFDVIAESARRLLRGWGALVVRSDGQLLHMAAFSGGGGRSTEESLRERFPRPANRETFNGAVILDRDVQQIADIETDEKWAYLRAHANRQGWRANLGVPMLHNGQPIGSISVTRSEPGAYSPQEVELLQTFAAQAVIAIENVRLFKELETRNRDLTESLEQQTATSEILRVISSSPTDLQPVLDAIAGSAARVCGAYDATAHLREGDLLRRVAHHGPILHGFGDVRAINRESASGRAVLEREPVHIHDVFAAGLTDLPWSRESAQRTGFRTILAVPLLREGDAIGALTIRRREVQPFTDKQLKLLQTFADQAVIAIENVRLFKELEEKNRALIDAHETVTESLERQTATSEILRVISGAHTDAQPVFDTIVQNAARLCHAAIAAVFLTDGKTVYHPANYGGPPDAMAIVRARYPRSLDMESLPGIAILTRSVVHVPDTEAPSVLELARQNGRLLGFRSIVTVPMLREGQSVGALIVGRPDPGQFSDTEVELLKTFGDQAVIAIENVRLFKELEARTHDLTRSVGELRALGEVGQAISSTLDLQTVLSTIVARATQLAAADAGVIYEYDEQREVFLPRATERLEAEIVETMLAAPVRKGEGATGRLAEVQEPIQLPDIFEAPAESRVRHVLGRAGYRALLAVPLLREGRLIGGLTVIRKAPGEFAPAITDLLRTFATQSALAIQNARLFREIADKSRQLEVASQHKSEFLANMSHELRTPLNAIIGFSEVLTDRMFGELNEKQEEYLRDIYASGTHLLSLINDILDLSKIEAGRMELEITDFDLPTAIGNALMLVRERAGRRSIALHTNIDNRLGQIQADERKVRQVVLNLLSNAIKFTLEGGCIDVGAVPKDGFVEVSVTDTGVGIAPEDQEKVFEEFRQVGTEAKKVEGTGLGLTLCRKFVELHGGRIWVKSELGVGSTFTFTIPMHRGE